MERREHLLGDAALATGASLLAIAMGVMVSAGAPRPVVMAAAAAIVLVLTFKLPAHWFVALGFVVFGTTQLTQSGELHFGSINVFGTDLFAGLAFLRAVAPIKRNAATGARLPAIVLIVAIPWAITMLISTWRGYHGGTPLETLIRLNTPLLYFPLYCWSGARILRERSMDPVRLLRLMALAIVGLIGFMLLMRGLGRPFETTNELGTIVTSAGSSLHRDYGFATAFILYPMLALAAAAYALYGRRSAWALGLALLGVVATLLTLLRSETYGLLLGGAALVLAAPAGVRAARSAGRAVQLVGGVVALFAVVAAVSPALGNGIIERSLPGAKESYLAANNADFRQQALQAGVRVAGANTLGLGDIPDSQLEISGVPPDYTAHSGLAWILAYNGWPGLAAAALAYFALLAASFARRRSGGWLHPAFVAIWSMLGAYSWGASGLAFQEWVVAAAAVAAAIRFVLPQLPSWRQHQAA